ncbi:hypothetical protein [Vibrio breoganii]|uniref:hypothetical protein n=1 Tax=Vibrio breoganii TaxID=553239 RepID=UPI000C83AC52|nr:hypothetical protein [Vibrio breoganii]PMK30648.1 hypothetical protein BCU03_09530 [Vibrio breoganii]
MIQHQRGRTTSIHLLANHIKVIQAQYGNCVPVTVYLNDFLEGSVQAGVHAARMVQANVRQDMRKNDSENDANLEKIKEVIRQLESFPIDMAK